MVPQGASHKQEAHREEPADQAEAWLAASWVTKQDRDMGLDISDNAAHHTGTGSTEGL